MQILDMDQIREMHFLCSFFNVGKQRKDSALKTGRSTYKMTIPAFETNIVVDLRKGMTRLIRYVFTVVE